MNRESQVRFVAVLLFLLTVAAVVFAGLNFQKERESAAPDDGIWWIERGGRLFAIVGDTPVMECVLVTRLGELEWTQEALFETDVPALVNAPQPQRFIF